ncbi:MAG TPA: transglutaminase family protein [Devosia sp.]
MKIEIQHRLSLGLGQSVPRAIQHLLLTPQTSSVQAVREWQLEVEGLDDPAGFLDAYGNRAHLASQTKPEAELIIAVSGVVETHDRSGVVGRVAREPVAAIFRRVTPLTKPVGAVMQKFRSASTDPRDRIPLLHAVMARVGEVLGGDGESQSQDGQSQSQSQGGERDAADHAHAFIGAARALDIPARYVTGYLAAEEGPRFHAWAEAWDDGLGWIGFDPVLQICPVESHVRVASALDAVSAAPVRSVPAVGTPQMLEMRVEAGQ